MTLVGKRYGTNPLRNLIMSDYEKLTPSSETRGDGEFVKSLQGQFGEGVQGGTHVHKD